MTMQAALYARIAPKTSVSGANATARAGTLVAQARLMPDGAHTSRVTNGFSPCSNACGHQAKDQTKICGSA